MAVPDVCFTSNSANVYNCTCTSSLPQLPPKPDFSPTTTTTPTPTATPTGNTTETTTNSTMTPMSTVNTEETTGTSTTSTTLTPDGNGITTFDTSATVTDLNTVTLGIGTTTPGNGITTPGNGLTTPDVTKNTSPSFSETTPLITTQGMTENSATTCGPNDTDCTARISDPTPGASAGVIVGCTCGAIIFLVLCGCLIWWLWKKGKCNECGKCCICCIVPIDDGSQDSLREEKQVELLKIEKKGTVILTPIPAPPAWPEQHDLQSTSPNPNRDITPVELSKEEEALPSQTTEGNPDSTTSRKKKKKKKKGNKSNKVSPEADQSPAPSTGGNETFANDPVLS